MQVAKDSVSPQHRMVVVPRRTTLEVSLHKKQVVFKLLLNSKIFPKSDHHVSPRHSSSVILFSEVFHQSQKTSNAAMSVTGCLLVQLCVGLDMLSTDSSNSSSSHAAESNTTGSRQSRNVVHCPPVAAQLQLNVSDDMTVARKNAHSSAALWVTRSDRGDAVWLCNSCAMRQWLKMNFSCYKSYWWIKRWHGLFISCECSSAQ